MHVHLGVSGPELLAKEPRKVEVAMPHDERNMRLIDLNADGKQDVLVHRAPTGASPDQPHLLTLLVAR